MSKIVINICLLLAVLGGLNSCRWVDDDMSVCPRGFHLKLIYSYNMLDVDAASTQVDHVSVFVFDQQGTCLEQMDVDSLALRQNRYVVDLPDLPAGYYDVLVWGGLDREHFQYTDRELSLVTDSTHTTDEQIPSLFHGRMDSLFIDGSYKVQAFPLVKNTNTVSCVVQEMGGRPFDTGDFVMELTADNGVMDHWNRPVPRQDIGYLPYFAEAAVVEAKPLLRYGITTLRLLAGDDTRLRLIHEATGQLVFDIPLTEYLLLSRDMVGYGMSDQEFLDRQDTYSLIFLLTATDDLRQPYLLTRMTVNGWIVRMDATELGRKNAVPRSCGQGVAETSHRE